MNDWPVYSDDPLRDLTQHSLNAHEVLPRRDVLLAAPPSPYKCLATTNVIESPQSGVARRTANVTRWRDREMVERWVASAWLLKEKNFRKIDGHRDLWALATILGRQPLVQPIAGEASVK